MSRESAFRCSPSISWENSVAMSAWTNLRSPKPTRSNSTPFTTLNTAITARPVWCVRAVINSRDYHTLRRLNRSVTCGAVTNGLRPYILLQGLILKPCAWSELTVSCRHAESFRPILLMSGELTDTVDGTHQ